MEQTTEKKTETYVQEYLRNVPSRYHRGPHRVDITLDKNGEALVVLRNREFLIHVIQEQSKPGTEAHNIQQSPALGPEPELLQWVRRIFKK